MYVDKTQSTLYNGPARAPDYENHDLILLSQRQFVIFGTNYVFKSMFQKHLKLTLQINNSTKNK